MSCLHSVGDASIHPKLRRSEELTNALDVYINLPSLIQKNKTINRQSGDI